MARGKKNRQARLLQKAQQEAAEAKALLAKQQQGAPVIRQQAVMQHTRMSVEALPMPTPETMHAYGQFGADVVDLLKKEQQFRHNVQNHIQRMDERSMDLAQADQRHEANTGRRAQWMAFGVFSIAMGVALALALKGQAVIATAIVGTTIATIIGLFLRSDATARKVAEARAQQVPGSELAPPTK